MGFLQRFFTNVFRDETSDNHMSSFDQLSEDELEAHLSVMRYGNFSLTDAVRPSYDLQVVPSQGFRHEIYRDEETNTAVPVVMGAASGEIVFDVFLELLDPLGAEVDVVLETSHNQDNRRHDDLYREHIDLPVLKSILCDYEDLLLHDGCTGIAVLNPNVPLEVQFDEHKLLIAYGSDLSEFEKVFQQNNIPCDSQIKFITEAEHVHSSSEKYLEQFQQLTMRLGMDSPLDIPMV